MEYWENLSLENLTGYDDDGNFHVEEWKDIPDYEGLYQGSTFGRVKSLIKRCGSVRILKLQFNKRYFHVILAKDKKHKMYLVHRIVAVTFIQNPKNKPSVNHMDLNKKNNCVWNLEWNTERENQTHYRLTQPKTSKYTGVMWCKRDGVWRAVIHIDNKLYHRGSYKIEEDARDSYINALKEYEETGQLKPYVNTKWTSQYKGVNYDKRTKRWEFSIMRNRVKHRGYGYLTEEEAIVAHKNKLKEITNI